MFQATAANQGTIHPLPRVIPADALYEWNQNEVVALEKITRELVDTIFEKTKDSYGGDLITIKVRPVCDNFGAYAQLKITQRCDLERVSLFGNKLPIFDKEALSQIIAAAVQKGRDGSRPQLIPFRIRIDKMLVRAEIRLFIGIRA